MKNEPKVSIVMPCYKIEKYLPECIESVLEQDYKNIEIIPVDDGSPDKSGQIIDEYAKRDSRIKPIHQVNCGYGNAVNNGMKIATGKYIAIVETDDYIETDMISTLVRYAEYFKADVVKAGFTKHYADGRIEKITPPFPFYKDYEDVYPEASNDLMLMESSIWAALYNLDFLKKNEIKMMETKGAAYQDSVFKFMVYASTDSVIVIPKSVYNYRVMTSNSSSKSTKNWDAQFTNYALLKEWLIKHNKFDNFVYAYYLHGYFDFLFHYGRISDDTKPLFLEKANFFYKEGRDEGVCKENARFASKDSRDYFWNGVVPFLDSLESNPVISTTAVSNSNAGHVILKKICKKVYSTKFGKFLWKKFEDTVKRPFIWNKIYQSPEGYYLPYIPKIENNLIAMGVPNNNFELYEASEKNVLVILPWYDNNATIQNLENILAPLKKIGYVLHLFLYYEHFEPDGIHAIWDKVFYKHADNPYFSHTNYSSVRPDGDHIDDWVDEDFCACIKRLNNQFHYKICFNNYLMFTKSFDFVDKDCKKIIYTHDKFSNRNKTLINAGFPAWSCWFGLVNEKEEARGLKRADLVFAVQEFDATFFRNITNNEVNVVTYPFIPPKKYIKKINTDEKYLSVGYIASSNPPNYFALKKLINSIKGSNVKLFIGGSICNMVKSEDLVSNCQVLGKVDSIDNFYSAYNLYINPDTFFSGIKCKTIEAMSYGVGIICTKVAATGYSLTEDYHNFDDEKECGDYLISLSKMNKDDRARKIEEIIDESKQKYEQFVKVYDKEVLTAEILRGVK